MSKVSLFPSNVPIVDVRTGQLTLEGVKLFQALFARVGGNEAPTNIENADTANQALTTANAAAEQAASAYSLAQTVGNASLVTVNPESGLANHRRIASGENASVTDGGAGSTISVGVSRNPSFMDDAGATLVQVSTGALGLWGAAPVAQATTALVGSTFVANAGTAINTSSTFDGYTLGQVVKALKNCGVLA